MTAESPGMNVTAESRAPDASLPVHPGPVTSLSDPRAIQILATEHWSQLASRSLAYNEAFVRGGMFLSLLSMSFVGLALLAQAMSFTNQFLIAAVVVLAFDFIIGALTYMRIFGANSDDVRAVHGMARIRHGYTEIAPVVAPYFTSATHDDIASVLTAYGYSATAPTSAVSDLLSGLSSSGGMIALIETMIGGLMTALLALLLGTSGELAILAGIVASVGLFALFTVLTFRAIARQQRTLDVRFPSPSALKPDDPAAAASTGE